MVQKNMVQERIIQESLRLFKEYGVRSVSMNMIADELHMSKRTIYNHFENKDQIVVACCEREFARIDQVFLLHETESAHAIEALVRIVVSLLQYNSSGSPAYFKEMLRYPEVQERCLYFRQQIERRCLALFMRGLQEGFFIPKVEYENFCKAFVTQLEQIKPEFQPGVSLTFLRGVCTERGCHEIERLIRTMNLLSVKSSYIKI